MSGAACPPSTAANNMIPNGHGGQNQAGGMSFISGSGRSKCCGFQMPLHYPRFKKADYDKMAESQLDCLLRQYGLPVIGDVEQKRKFAMGAFLWPDQY